jgi:hypothetical protein
MSNSEQTTSGLMSARVGKGEQWRMKKEFSGHSPRQWGKRYVHISLLDRKRLCKTLYSR